MTTVNDDNDDDESTTTFVSANDGGDGDSITASDILRDLAFDTSNDAPRQATMETDDTSIDSTIGATGTEAAVVEVETIVEDDEAQLNVQSEALVVDEQQQQQQQSTTASPNNLGQKMMAMGAASAAKVKNASNNIIQKGGAALQSVPRPKPAGAGAAAASKVVVYNKKLLENMKSMGAKMKKYNVQQSSSLLKRILDMKMTDSQRLATDENYRTRAFTTLMVLVFVDAANISVLGPNYPVMVLPGSHPDSFPSTAPFGFAAANHFIPMSFFLASATASLVTGRLSDRRFGRRNLIIMNLLGSAIATLGKYAARHSFWAYCGVNFINGLFSSTSALGLGYISDLYLDDRVKSDAGMGLGVAINVVGRGCGSLLPIGMPRHLFLPLIVSAALNFMATILAYFMLPEPISATDRLNKETEALLEAEQEGKLQEEQDSEEQAIVAAAAAFTANSTEKDSNNENDKHDDEEDEPDVLHQATLWNILVGAFADNVGSVGLVPLCLSPLMFTEFYANFAQVGETPVMHVQAFRWIYVMVAFIVVPGALISPLLFKRFGPALCCVVANILTGAVIVTLLYIAMIEPPTTTTFVVFTVILYVTFPLTIISQVSTGPMLDRIAPIQKRGQVQGFNMATQDYASAIFPFLYGILADNRGLNVALWTATAASLAAALINSPLVFNPRLANPKSKTKGDGEDDEMNITDDTTVNEDQELLQRIRNGEYVPVQDLFEVNLQRMDRGESIVTIPIGQYDPHDPRLVGSKEKILADFTALRNIAKARLALLNENPELKQAYAEEIYANFGGTHDEEELQAQRELGMWIGEYLKDNGYYVREFSPVLKHMIKSSFPPMGDLKPTPESVESRLLNFIKLLNRYINLEKESTSDPLRLLAAGNMGGPVRRSIIVHS